MANNTFDYLHGFSTKEQTRLVLQARLLEQIIYQSVDYSESSNLLEVGSGVGAQTEILLRRFPNLKITGIDLSKEQMSAANSYLSQISYAQNRYELKQMSATEMEFESNSFDSAFLCWILEHIPNPIRALSEIRRILAPGSPVVITEVMNSSFFLEPYAASVQQYWARFNDLQYDLGGDPFVGAKLGNLLQSVGFQQIQTEIKIAHFDNRFPEKRKRWIQFWKELLLSASDQLLEKNYVSLELIEKTKEELEKIGRDPNAVFFYAFVQARAVVY